MHRVEKARGLAQDRDDARFRLQLCDLPGGGVRPEVDRSCLARALAGHSVAEE